MHACVYVRMYVAERIPTSACHHDLPRKQIKFRPASATTISHESRTNSDQHVPPRSPTEAELIMTINAIAKTRSIGISSSSGAGGSITGPCAVKLCKVLCGAMYERRSRLWSPSHGIMVAGCIDSERVLKLEKTHTPLPRKHCWARACACKMAPLCRSRTSFAVGVQLWVLQRFPYRHGIDIREHLEAKLLIGAAHVGPIRFGTWCCVVVAARRALASITG